MKQILISVVVAMTLTACSTSELVNKLPDNRPNYKMSRTTNPLEIPPDLTQSSIDDSLNVAELSATDNASLSAYQNERKTQSHSVDKLKASLQSIQTKGDVSWIVIKGEPGDVFNKAKRFWQDNGLGLSRVDAGIGIMETDWLENKKNVPTSGISAIIGRVISGLTDEGVRDKFRTRVDYDGTNSLVYITHYGATEEQLDDRGKIIRNNQTKSNRADFNTYKWVEGSRNPELEVEMLRRMNLYLHKKGKVSVKPSASANSNMRLSRLADGTPALVINDTFNNAWLVLGIAIDRSGFDLSSQNRQNGIYRFEKITERKVGFILKDVERDIESYQIGLADQGQQQVAVIRSVNGKKPTQAQAQAVLQQIAKGVRF